MKKINANENVKTITSNDFITARGLNNLSLKARKLLYIAISQCKKNDKDFYAFEISIREFARLMDIAPDAIYTEADKITDELMAGVLQVMPTGAKYFTKYSLFSMCEYRHDGILRFKLNPDMTHFLLNLKKDFSQPLLQDFLHMNSSYSIAIWHLMQKKMNSFKPGLTDTIQLDLSLKELREVTGTENKLKQLVQFKEKCFDKALREIYENCAVKISYENIKQGRTVVGFRCKVVSAYHIDSDKVPQKIKDKARLGALKIKSKQQGLTSKELDEYEQLNQEFELKF